MPDLLRASDVLLVVTNDEDRGIKIPTPRTNQCILNVGANALQKWDGGAWVTLVTFA